MAEYLAPGVYVEEIDTGSKPIEGVSTTTAGMLGVTERGPANVPILITGTGEFTRWFGGHLQPDLYSNGQDPHWYLPHAIDGFFTNGGKRVFVTRVLDTELAQPAATTLFDRGNASSAATVLLRAAAAATGTTANPPLLVVLDGTNLAQNDFVRIGDGSDAEYHRIASPLAAEDVLIPISLPLSRSHIGSTVEQFTPGTPLATYTLAQDAKPVDQIVVVDGAAADISALSVDDLLEIGPTATSSEHRFVRQVSLLSATRARVLLDSGILLQHLATTPVRHIPLGAGPPTANLDPSVSAAAAMAFVDARGGNFDTRTDLIVVDSADATTREVRRIGELHSVTVAPAAVAAYPASSLVEGITLSDSAIGTVVGPTAGPIVDVSDVTTLSVRQTMLVGPLGGVFETVVIQSIAPGVAPAGQVTLTAPFATAAAGGEQVIAVGTMTADTTDGQSFLAIDNRLGLSPGDTLRIGDIPDDEYATIASIPNRAPMGMRPDPGTVILASPLVGTHARATTPVIRQDIAAVPQVDPTVTALAVAKDDDDILLADGATYGPPPPPAHLFIRLTTPSATYFHRVAASTLAAPLTVELDAPLSLAHLVGAPVIERQPLFDVQALDAGIWGNRLRLSVADEAPGLVSRTTLTSVGLSSQIRLGSISGVEQGTILELLDPTAAPPTPVGGLLKVGLVNRLTGDITLDGIGLDAGQQAAYAAAIGAGMFLGVRSREFSLTVQLLRQQDPANPARNDTALDVERFRYLSMDPRHSHFVEQVVGAIDGPPRMSDHRPDGGSWYVRVADHAPTPAAQLEIRLGPETLTDVLPDGRTQAARPPLNGGNDSINTLTDQTYVGDDDGIPEDRTGLQSLRNVDEISIIACPGRTGSQIQSALIDHCESMRYRFAVLDGPAPTHDTLTDVQNQRQQYDTKYAALYYPWLSIPDPYPANPQQISDIAIASAGHVVGVYARTDIERGVHKAPANEIVRGATGLRRILNKEQQDILNPSPVNINVIRDFRPYDRGIRIYGARCITSDPDWKYVNVRRLMIFIEASIDDGLQWVVFEPNAEPLWARVRRSISNFLTLVWRNGALEGTKPEEAFFVKCDRTTMTQSDIDNGRLICVVGVAPVKPAEFVIVQIAFKTDGGQ